MAILNRDALAIIMIGATHVIDMGGKTAFIHYQNDHDADMLLPDGKRFDGRWSLVDHGYRVDWKDGPSGSWRLDHAPGAIDYLDASGVARGRLLRIEFGDPAGLAGQSNSGKSA